MSVARHARRIGLVAGAILSVGGLGYAAIRIVSDADDALKRIGKAENQIERHEGEIRGFSRVEAKVDRVSDKVDLLMTWFGVPKPPPQPAPVVREAGPETTP